MRNGKWPDSDMNVLVVNLTRFGDLLQSAATVRALAKKDGKNRIGVVCLENFAAGAELLPEVDAIFPMPSGKILAALNAPSDASPEWLNGVKELYTWVSGITCRFSPDVVYNISPTTSSCLLGRLLADGVEYSGFTIDSFGYRHNANPWAAFMQGASASRAGSPFNIVDIFRKIAGDTQKNPDASLLPVPQSAIIAMAEKLQSKTPEKIMGYVALQLGASAAARQWPVASFAMAGDALWKQHKLLPLLLGSSAERPLGEEYAHKAQGKHISLIGETDITELGAALSLSSLLISNDTGTLHLGSGIGVPVIGIYLATAQAWDTGPYADGNHSLEPDIPCHPCEFGTVCEHSLACHQAITPETVTALAGKVLFPDAENFSGFEGSRVWQSSHDGSGFADLASLSGHENTERTQWMRLQRIVYRQFFDRNTALPFVFEPAADFSMNPPEHPRSLLDSIANECDAILVLFDALLQQGAMLSQHPLPTIKERFQRTLHRLTSLLSATPSFAAIAYMWHGEIMTQTSLEASIPLMTQYRDLFKALRITV